MSEKKVDKDKRVSERRPAGILAYVRKKKADGKEVMMEFFCRDLSMGGVFLLTENLSVFDMGEEVEVMIKCKGKPYYSGNARIVRSARIFFNEGKSTESGYGLSFSETSDTFRKEVEEHFKALAG